VSDELDPITPEAALDYYLETRRYDLADETMTSHRYRLESFVEWLVSEDHGDGEVTNLNEIDLRTIHAYRVFKREENWEDQEPCNAVSMQGQVSTIRVFLEHLVGIDAVDENLHERVKLPKVRDGDGVDERLLEAERATSILEYMNQWEYATANHVAFLIFWRTSCRLGDLRALDIKDFDPEEGALSFRHRPSTGTPLKNKKRGERDASLKPHVVEVIEEYLESPNRHEVTDEHGRTRWSRPRAATRDGDTPELDVPDDPALSHRRGVSRGAGPERVRLRNFDQLAGCPDSLSPHPVRAGSITAHRDAGTPREVVSDRGDVSEKILEEHYDQASERERMRRRREFIPDNL